MKGIHVTVVHRASVVTLVSMIVATTGWLPTARAYSAENEANALARRVMSPYCPGLLLADCRSDGARELRAEILQRVRSGEKTDAIEDDLVMRFGAVIRTVPALEGIGLVAWLGPLAFGLAGIGLVVLVLRRLDGQTNTIEHTGIEQESTLNERLQEELDALD